MSRTLFAKPGGWVSEVLGSPFAGAVPGVSVSTPGHRLRATRSSASASSGAFLQCCPFYHLFMPITSKSQSCPLSSSSRSLLCLFRTRVRPHLHSHGSELAFPVLLFQVLPTSRCGRVLLRYPMVEAKHLSASTSCKNLFLSP